MEIKRVAAIYFSATGTTARIVNTLAEKIAEQMGVPVSCLEFTLPEQRTFEMSFQKGDLVLCGTPVYAGRVPNVLLPYLQKKIQGNGALAVPVVLYGNRNYDDALIELRDILEADGMHTIAGGAFVGEHSFSYTLAAGRPDARDLQEASCFAGEIVKRVRALKDAPCTPVYVKGETPLRPYYTPRDRKGNPVNILKVKPKVNDNCTRCGICARVCPMGSIDAQDVTQCVGICIKCGACIKKCPAKARFYDDAGYLYHRSELEEGYTRRAAPECF